MAGKNSQMKTRYRAEQIVVKPPQADVALGKGLKVPEVCRRLGIREQTYCRMAATCPLLGGRNRRASHLSARTRGRMINGPRRIAGTGGRGGAARLDVTHTAGLSIGRS